MFDASDLSDHPQIEHCASCPFGWHGVDNCRRSFSWLPPSQFRRTLDLLERNGMLARVHVDLLCSGCNTVVPVDPTGVEAEILQLAEELKFRVDTDTLEFAALCESCQAHNAARGQQTSARRGATRRAWAPARAQR